ncbi:MAG: hypothetical protein OEW19_17165, partial [Acidobacteriota bacterium]|nr:hypothetical protein [Acidobacteriota bacterium]
MRAARTARAQLTGDNVPGHAEPNIGMLPASTALLSRFLTFDRDGWARLRDSTPLTLSESDLDALRGLNERLSLDEVVEIYLPLSRLLNLHVCAVQSLYRASQRFLGNNAEQVPFIIG